jgi:hypothetical protein
MREFGPAIVSLPALARTTAMYGSMTAPAIEIQRYGFGRKIEAIKQPVLTIIEMK